MIVISLLALVASVSAACSENMKCGACIAATNCTWCDMSTYASCQDNSALEFSCTTGVKTTSGGMCPDKCANNTVTANKCKIPAGSKVQTPMTCSYSNDVFTTAPTTVGTTSSTVAVTLDKCSMAIMKDGAACAQAFADFGCSYGCQACTDGAAFGAKLCKSVCDGFKAKCPTTATDCATSPFDYACAADGVTDCVSVTIEGTPAAGASTTAPTTAPTTMKAGDTPATTTVAIKEGDCNQKTCTACATAKCTWCSTGMTKETETNANCIAANATCTSTQSAYKEVDKCVKDANDACEAHTACAACAADTKCSWCDTGAAIAGAVGLSSGSTGSCNSGTTCTSSVKPTAAADCKAATTTSSATTATVAIFAVLGALLAAF